MISAVVGGHPHRVDGQTVERRQRGVWRALTRAELLALPADGELWTWLREHGVKRPSPSGRSLTDAERGTVRVTVHLPPAAAEALDRLVAARGSSRSAVLADLLASGKAG